jgi:hypothetical protein
MIRAKKFLLFFIFLLFFLFFFVLSPHPDAKLCTVLALQSLENPRYYDLATNIGCSRRQIINALNLEANRDSNSIRRLIQNIFLSL